MQQLQNAHQLNAIILDQLPIPWFVFNVHHQQSLCSHALKELLGFSGDQAITLDQVYHALSVNAYSALYKAIQDTLQIGSLFSLQMRLEHQNKEIIISGQKIYQPHANKAHQEYIYLVFEDITNTHQKHRKDMITLNQLRQECDILKGMINQIPMALWHRNKKGCIDYCNDTYAFALGYTREKIITENLDLLPTSDIDLYAQSIQALQLTQPCVERVHAVLQGQRRYLEIGTDPNCQQQTTVGYAIDMTEVSELEKQLKDTTSAYHEILNAISVPIAVYNQKKRLTFYNHAFVKLFDFNAIFLENDVNLADILDDLRNRKKIPEFHNFKEFKRQQLDLFNNMLKAREEFIDLPNDDTLRVHIAPYPLGGIIFVYENITDQLNLQRGVNTLQAVQKETINHLYEALIVIEQNGKIQLLNQAMFQLFNIDPAMQYLGQHFHVWSNLLQSYFADTEQYQRWQEYLLDLFTNRHPIQERLFLLNDLVVNWFYTPLPDGSHMLGFLNISEQWQQELLFKEQAMSLEKSDANKKQYIQQVTHQLERPINNVVGFSKALSQQLFGSLNEKQRHYCSLIERNIKNIRFLIHDVLSLLGVDQDEACVEPKVFLFLPLMKSLEEIIEDVFQDKDMDFIFTGKISNEKVYACERSVKQGLFTLIKDLANRIPQGGTITIDTHNKVDENMLLIQISAACDGELAKEYSLGSSIAKHIFEMQKITIHEGKINMDYCYMIHLPMSKQ